MKKQLRGKSPMELARIAGYVVQNILEERKQTSRNLGKSFAYWVKAYGPKTTNASDDRVCKPLRIPPQPSQAPSMWPS